MATSKAESDSYFTFDHDVFLTELNKVIQSLLPRLDKAVISYVWFNLFFLALLIAEVSLLCGLFGWLVQSSLVAVALSLIFLTVFAYFILKIYFFARKPEQFEEFAIRFAKGAESLIKYREGMAEHHFAMANAYHKMAGALHQREYSFFRPPLFLDILAPSLEKLSCSLFWNDFYLLKELFLKKAVEEHLLLIRCEPTNLDVHASLANAYVNLSSLYVDPRPLEGYEESIWIPKNKYLPEHKERFKEISKRAIEEFKILESYAPNDPWVHTQLAYSYHDLGLPEEEIKEWEAVIKLRPDDKEGLYRLGKLYFSQGMNARGLKIYEELILSNYKKAEELIKYYGNTLTL